MHRLITGLGAGNQAGVLDPLGVRGLGCINKVSAAARLGSNLGRDVGLGLAQAAVVCGDGLLHILGQVVPQMPAVSDLDRVGGAALGSFGVGPGAVTADHLRTGVQRGYELAGIPVDEWTRRLTARAEAGDHTLSLITMHVGPTDPSAVVDRHDTLAGSSTGLPVIDEKIIARYLDFFVECGFFPAPSGVGR